MDIQNTAAHAEYIVIRRAGFWNYTIGGDQYGPFQNQVQAQDAAIREAKRSGRLGHPARVSVDELDHSLPVIFDTESQH